MRCARTTFSFVRESISAYAAAIRPGRWAFEERESAAVGAAIGAGEAVRLLACPAEDGVEGLEECFKADFMYLDWSFAISCWRSMEQKVQGIGSGIKIYLR